MRHVLVVNVAGHGYATFAGDPSTSFEMQPSGIATAKVSEAVVTVCNEVDEVVRASPTLVTLVARRDETGATVLALGGHFPNARDEKGREGLIFIHALEFNASAALPRVVGALFRCISPTAFQRLSDEVARVAVQSGAARGFLQSRSQEIEQQINVSTVAESAAGLRIGAIEHDLPGGQVVAWTAFALASSRLEGPWQINDRFDGDRSVTVMTPTGGGQEKASDLFHEGLHRVLEARGYLAAPRGFADASDTRVDAPGGSPGRGGFGDSTVMSNGPLGANEADATIVTTAINVRVEPPSRTPWMLVFAAVLAVVGALVVPRLLSSGPERPHSQPSVHGQTIGEVRSPDAHTSPVETSTAAPTPRDRGWPSNAPPAAIVQADAGATVAPAPRAPVPQRSSGVRTHIRPAQTDPAQTDPQQPEILPPE